MSKYMSRKNSMYYIYDKNVEISDESDEFEAEDIAEKKELSKYKLSRIRILATLSRAMSEASLEIIILTTYFFAS